MNQENEEEEDIISNIKIDKDKVNKQKFFYIQGIKIYFPYDPYPPQKLYMEKVIIALNR